VKSTTHYTGEVEREVKDFMIGAEDGGCTGKAGVGSSAYYDFKITESVFKLFDDGLSCINLTEAYGVEPDTFFQSRVFTGNFAEAISPSGAISSVSDHPIHNGRGYCQGRQQIYTIDDEFHSDK
jgi:hypothetical protein